jgi:hypothetical protein
MMEEMHRFIKKERNYGICYLCLKKERNLNHGAYSSMTNAIGFPKKLMLFEECIFAMNRKKMLWFH